MGADEAATLDALIGRREILDGLIATHAGRTGAWSCTLMKRLRTGTVVEPIRSRAARASDRASSDLDASGKPEVGVHLVDHRATQACDLTDLRQPQNPNRAAFGAITVIMAKLRRVFG
jgi:hypothetical protein